MNDNHDEKVHRVQIKARGAKAAIEIDGQLLDSGALSGYTVSHREGEPPQVVLLSRDDVQADFNGLARVAVADLPDPGPAAEEFLASIDAEALERTALARLDVGTGPNSLTQAMLIQLREWARGD
ncbi:hypothetical protein [Streptomyces noursei]|uniref:hypothetical protein n=1 Tax=Streptomyces noursei TaxID=1971 RepID=UPI00045F0717|nr:hypothetical protein [Streptomyces noursei]AIA03451.1 hypothetical protein DC74_2951 [Streptomyces noursei]